jgi:hypothetical protein
MRRMPSEFSEGSFTAVKIIDTSAGTLAPGDLSSNSMDLEH